MPLEWTRAMVDALAPSVAASPWPLEGPADVLVGSKLFELTHAGSHLLMAVRPVTLAGGLRLDVVGLVSDGDRMQSAAIDAAVEYVAREFGCSALAMCTISQHLEKTCARNGWKKTGVVMAKGVGNVQ